MTSDRFMQLQNIAYANRAGMIDTLEKQHRVESALAQRIADQMPAAHAESEILCFDEACCETDSDGRKDN